MMKKGMLLSLMLLSSMSCYGATKKEKQLYDAAEKGDVAKVRQLLDAGVDVNARHLGESALPIAAAGGHREVVKLLLDRGADSNTRTFLTRFTPLIYAAAKGHVDVVKLLLNRGADVKLKNSGGLTASSIAVTNRALTIESAKKAQYDEIINLLADAEKKQNK